MGAGPPDGAERAVRDVLERHDDAWTRLDVAGVASLWVDDDASAAYLGDECSEPVVGPVALAKAWARLGGRLQGARQRTRPEVVGFPASDVAVVMARVEWAYHAVGGVEPHEGRSWVMAVLRRDGAAGAWRFVATMERLADLGPGPSEDA